MNAIDLNLQQLAKTVDQFRNLDNPQNRRKRREALTQLYHLITKDERLHSCYYSLRQNYIGYLGQQLFEECYQDALGKTWLEFLEKYDHEQAKVLSWFQQILKYRFLDIKNEYLQIRKSHQKIFVNRSLDKPIFPKESNYSEYPITYGDLLPSSQKSFYSNNYAEDLIEIIKTDQWQIFTNKYLRGLPSANYQAIAIKRYEGKSWQEIAQELNTNIGSITPFFTRCNQYFRPIIHELLLGQFVVSEPIIYLIEKDKNNQLKNRKFIQKVNNKRKEIINLQELLLTKLQQKGLNWQKLTELLEVPTLTFALIYFYLDSLGKLKTIFQDEFYQL